MKLVSIEPTPSPNTMKLNLDTSLPKGMHRTYTKERADGAPDYIRRLLSIPGVKSVFHTADFIAIDRFPKGDWESILAQVRETFGEGVDTGTANAGEAAAPDTEHFGEANVFVQMFRGIPMQVRVRAGNEEARVALPDRFAQAAIRAGTASPNLIKERKLVDFGVRYGDLQEIADQVVRELDASYDEARLNQLVEHAMKAGVNAEETIPRMELSDEETARWLEDPDWKKRYAALERMKPSMDKLPLLIKALRDPEVSVRRLAAVYMGDIRDPAVLPYLFEALKDRSAIVRRTAGDTLSDIGDPAAISPMCEALKDENKLVRWRAARFLYEIGDETALPALRDAADDPEFEVRLQVQMAIKRIESGEAAAGTVWQQMTRRNHENPDGGDPTKKV